MSQVIRKFDNGGSMAVASNQMPPKNVIFVVNIILIRELLDELISLQRSLGEIQGVLKGKQDTLLLGSILLAVKNPNLY